MKLRALGVASIAALTLFTIALPAQQSALPYTVVTRAGRQPLAARAMNGQDMFALDDLARIFNLSTKEDTLAGGLTVTVGTQTIVLSPQQPLASVAGRMISLPAAPVRDGRAWYVPVDFVSRALAPISPIKIDLRKPSRLVIVGDVRMPRVAARAEALGTTTRVTLDVAPPTPHTVTQEGSKILVRFDADALDAADLKSNLTSDTLQGIHAGDTPQTVTIDLGPRFGTSRSSDQPAPAGASRIVVDLVSQETPQPNQPGQPAQAQPPQPATPEPPLLDLPPAGGLRTIVIDAGHGGDDAGAKGAQGTLEKNVTLGIARRLKGSIEARLGVRVLLTRDGDQNVGPDQRAAVANNNKADLFISLHASASVRPTVAGAQVFYLTLAAFGTDANAASRGNPEALPVVGGGSREIEIIPWEMAQGRYLPQSAAFAGAIEGALREHVPMSARALQQAPLRVLVGVNMPAVLVEVGFLTNAEQERLLEGDTFQNTLVQALTEGIIRYRAAAPAAGTTK
ncbi:MAG TPA: N-acetylmuramoyl-L-alanine amidase [Vicinamibacterales bacterium]|nr:N-acetylmuramoyl-L-alanine amidase [Vicinamibacterales bacterium]